MSRIEIGGASYAVQVDGEGPPLLLIHGFTGRGSDWAPVVPALCRAATTIAVDLLGHGDSDSPADPARHAVERQAADLAAILRRLGLAPAHVAGYSLGARIALRIAVSEPDVVARLILESPSAGIADPAQRAGRRATDEQLAHLLEREGIEAFVDRWESLPLFASERSLPDADRVRIHAARLRNRPDGLAASLRGAGQGSMEPLYDQLSSVTAPTLVVAGALDEIGLGRAEAVVGGIPGARLAIMDGVGHAPHREAPDRLERLLLDFLALPAPLPVERTPT